MHRSTMVRWLALILCGLSVAGLRLAAQDAPSVAEAAKRARQQKQESAKPAKVITNDSLPAAADANPATSSDATRAASRADASAPAAAGADNKKPSESEEDIEKKKSQTESLRKQLAGLQDAINTQQGAIALDQDTYYSAPDYKQDTAGKEKIDAEKRELERMEIEMAELKAMLAELGVVIEPKPPAPRESITPNAPRPQP
jgi:Gon7 family